MKILITGGAGFIGSNLANELTKQNNVVVFDNFNTGKLDNLNYSDNLKVIEGDITDYAFFNKVLKDEYDVIYHLAAIASVAASVENPLHCNEVNFKATLNLLEQVRKNKFKTKIVFASSAAVYGDNEKLPLKESDPVKPLSPYAIDKYAAEQYIINYSHLYGLDTCAARFFNVYGPKQDPKSPYSGVISILMNTVFEESKEFKIFGDGLQTRDFVYIEDLVMALIKMGFNKNSKGKVYNIGTGKSVSILDLIHSLEVISDSIIPYQHLESRNGDVKKSRASIENLSVLGYHPSFDLIHGLKELYEYELKKREVAVLNKK